MMKLVSVCNAPTNKSGVYLVWNSTCNGNKELIYIGRSGKKENGKIVHRKAGLGELRIDWLMVTNLGSYLKKNMAYYNVTIWDKKINSKLV